MTSADEGEAMPTTNIVWLAGSSPDYSEREKLLVANAYAEGYAEGERYGRRTGGEDALRDMTTLASMLNDKRVIEALAELNYFVQRQVKEDR